LRPRQPHCAILHLWPGEFALFQAVARVG
jgi:hypothetical protein